MSSLNNCDRQIFRLSSDAATTLPLGVTKFFLDHPLNFFRVLEHRRRCVVVIRLVEQCAKLTRVEVEFQIHRIVPSYFFAAGLGAGDGTRAGVGARFGSTTFAAVA